MRPSSLLIAFIAAVQAAEAQAQTLVSSMSGNAFDYFGSAVIDAGFQDADTYTDLLVAAPNSSLSAVRCISGRFLATGQGPSELWTLAPPQIGNPSSFGVAMVDAGNLTGNSARDFVIGAPGYDVNPFSGINNGALFLIDGSTHAVAATIYGANYTMLGGSIASVGDQNGDGKNEIASTAVSLNGAPSLVHVFSGASFVGNQSLAAAGPSSFNVNGAGDFGDALTSGFDLNGDGKRDLAIGSPRMFGGKGVMHVITADGAFTTLAAYVGTGTENMATSIGAAHDYNGDGVVDFVVGAPHWSSNHATFDGRAVVLSGARLLASTLPFELATFSSTTGGVATHLFGAKVRASPDLNRDGVGDILIGAPEYSSVTGADRGAVYIYSGATLQRITTILGNVNDNLGDSILGAYQDVDGDLFPEFAVAGADSDNPLGHNGVLKVYRLFPVATTTYCIPKQNSLGCWPSIGWSGAPSAAGATPFAVTCISLINQTSGLLIYSSSSHITPFQGGYLCIKAPLRRTAVLNTGGSGSGTNCSGALNYDFAARMASGVDPSLVAGAQVSVQCWSRDSAAQSATSLSDALRFLVHP